MKTTSMKAWIAVLFATAAAVTAARCSVDVPLGVDPASDAAPADANADGGAGG